MMTPFTRILSILFTATLCLLAGCKEILYSQLGEQEANEMIAVLATNGVNVSKTFVDKHWGIQVASSQIPLAMQVLTREGLPRGRYASLGDMFKREGIVSTPTEERIRFIHGVSQELSRTLSMIDGVLAARVHIVLPQNDPLADRARPSSASVFIRHRTDMDLQGSLTSIKSLVVRSVEGLSHDSVYVTLFPAERVALNPPVAATDTILGVTVPGVVLELLNLAAIAALLILCLAAVWLATRYLPAGRSVWLGRLRQESSNASANAARSDASL
jgi:type III secretion protein J